MRMEVVNVLWLSRLVIKSLIAKQRTASIGLCIAVTFICSAAIAASLDERLRGTDKTDTAEQGTQDKAPDGEKTFTIEGTTPKKSPPSRTPLVREPRTTKPKVEPLNTINIISDKLRVLLRRISEKEAFGARIMTQARQQWRADWYQSLIIEQQYVDFFWSVLALRTPEHVKQQMARNLVSFRDTYGDAVNMLFLYPERRQLARLHYQDLQAAKQIAEQALASGTQLQTAYNRLLHQYSKVSTPFTTISSAEPTLHNVAPVENSEALTALSVSAVQQATPGVELTKNLLAQIATFEKIGDYKAAINWSQRLLSSDNSYANNARLARLYTKSNDHQSALYYLKQMQSMQPSRIVSKWIISAHIGQNNLARADVLLKTMQTLAPDDPELLAAQAQISTKQAQWEQSNALYQTLLERQQLNFEMQTDWARSYAIQAHQTYQLGLPSQARLLARRSIDIMPTAEGYLALAAIEQMSNNDIRALHAIYLAYQKQPTQAIELQLRKSLTPYIQQLPSQAVIRLTQNQFAYLHTYATISTLHEIQPTTAPIIHRQGKMHTTDASRLAIEYQKKARQAETAGYEIVALGYLAIAQSLAPESLDTLYALNRLQQKNGLWYANIATLKKLYARDLSRRVLYRRDLQAQTNRLVDRFLTASKSSKRTKNTLVALIDEIAPYVTDSVDTTFIQNLQLRLHAALPVRKSDAIAIIEMTNAIRTPAAKRVFAEACLRAAYGRFAAADTQQAWQLLKLSMAHNDSDLPDARLLLVSLLVEQNNASSIQQAAEVLATIDVDQRSPALNASHKLVQLLRVADIFASHGAQKEQQRALALAANLMPDEQWEDVILADANRLMQRKQYQAALHYYQVLDQSDKRVIDRQIDALVSLSQFTKAAQLAKNSTITRLTSTKILLGQSLTAETIESMRDYLGRAKANVSDERFVTLVSDLNTRFLQDSNDAERQRVWLKEVVRINQTQSTKKLYQQAIMAQLLRGDITTTSDVASIAPPITHGDAIFYQQAGHTAWQRNNTQLAMHFLLAVSPKVLPDTLATQHIADTNALSIELLQQGDTTRALDVLQHVNRYAPSAITYTRIGDIYYLKKDLVAAYQSWRQAEQLGATNQLLSDKLRKVAFVEQYFVHNQDPEATIQAIESQLGTKQLSDQKAFLVQMYTQLAKAMLAKNDLVNAKRVYQRALGYDTINSLVLTQLADIATKQQQWNEAIYYRTKLLRYLRPTDSNYARVEGLLIVDYQAYAQQLEGINHLGNAVVMLEKALAIAKKRPNNRQRLQKLHEQLSRYYKSLGDQKKATSHAKQAGIV